MTPIEELGIVLISGLIVGIIIMLYIILTERKVKK